jgi:hypothetical protein
VVKGRRRRRFSREKKAWMDGKGNQKRQTTHRGAGAKAGRARVCVCIYLKSQISKKKGKKEKRKPLFFLP